MTVMDSESPYQPLCFVHVPAADPNDDLTFLIARWRGEDGVALETLDGRLESLREDEWFATVEQAKSSAQERFGIAATAWTDGVPWSTPDAP
jgi:hypothetical protein